MSRVTLIFRLETQPQPEWLPCPLPPIFSSVFRLLIYLFFNKEQCVHLSNTKCYTGFQETVATLSLSQALAEERAPARDVTDTGKMALVTRGSSWGGCWAPLRLQRGCRVHAWSVTKPGDLKASLEENQPSRSPHCALGPHWGVSRVLFLHVGLTSSNRAVFHDPHQHCTSLSWDNASLACPTTPS